MNTLIDQASECHPTASDISWAYAVSLCQRGLKTEELGHLTHTIQAKLRVKKGFCEFSL